MKLKCLIALLILSFTSLSFSQQRSLNDSVEAELKTILSLSKYYKLSLSTRFLECEFYKNCSKESAENQIVNQAPLYHHDNLSVKEQALNFLYFRMLTLENVKQEHIIWYINGLSKLRDIDQRLEKMPPNTFDYLQKFTYVAYDKITGSNTNTDQFKYFKYSKNGEALYFYYKAEDKVKLEKLVEGFTIQNDVNSLKYIDLRGITLSIDPTTHISTKETVAEKFKSYLATFSVSGNMNKIVVRPNSLNSSNYIIYGNNNTVIASDRQLINGNNNLVINSSDVEMYGSENTVLQLNTLKQKQTNHLIKEMRMF
ncbi:MAG: hypothetical protein U0T83_04460 [Bacteriovoracaceae bacterium]